MWTTSATCCAVCLGGRSNDGRRSQTHPHHVNLPVRFDRWYYLRYTRRMRATTVIGTETAPVLYLVGVAVAVGILAGSGYILLAAIVPIVGIALVLNPAQRLFFGISMLGVLSVSTAYYVVLIILIIGFIGLSLASQSKFRRTPLALVLSVFVAYLASSMYWTDVPLGSAAITLAPSLVLLLGTVTWPLDRRSALTALALAGVGQAILTLAAAVIASERVTQYGAFALPTALFGAVACLGLSFKERRRHHRAWLRAGTATCLAGIAATETRGMLLAAAVGILALPLFLARARVRQLETAARSTHLRLTAKVFFINAVVVAVLLSVTVRFFSRFAPEEVVSGITTRWSEVQAALHAIQESVLFGHGIGYVFTNPIVGTVSEVNYTHNSLLYFSLAGGLCGLFIFVTLLWKLLRSTLTEDAGVDGATLGAMLIALVVFSLTAALQRTLHFNLLMALIAGTSGRGPILRRGVRTH